VSIENSADWRNKNKNKKCKRIRQPLVPARGFHFTCIGLLYIVLPALYMYKLHASGCSS